MNFTKIKIGTAGQEMEMEFHYSIPLWMWMRLEGRRIPVCIDKDNVLRNRITASVLAGRESYPSIDMQLSEREAASVIALCPPEDKYIPEVYVPGIGFIDPGKISDADNHRAGQLQKF